MTPLMEFLRVPREGDPDVDNPLFERTHADRNGMAHSHLLATAPRTTGNDQGEPRAATGSG